MISDDVLHERVARGAALLDESYGPKWRRLFRGGRLPTLANFELCILGVLHGSYHQGVMNLFKDPDAPNDGLRTDRQWDQAVAHGFVTARDEADPDDYYDRLLEAWKPEVQRRGIP